MTQSAFSSLSLHADLLTNLSSLGYESMTPIQAQSLPDILAGKDMIAQAKTGSGKTAAFALGLLNRLDVKRFCVQSLVLCPTRELADQVAQEIRRLARGIHNIKVLTLCGGVPLQPQVLSLSHGAHIIVGTPGRVEDHLGKETLKLDKLEMLVLDEADRMLEMGFQASLDAIIDQTPATRQTLLFSATFPDQIRSISKRIMVNPLMVQASEQHDNSTIEQHFFHIEAASRLKALRVLLQHTSAESTVVFCITKRDVQDVASALATDGYSVAALHGDLEQRDRDQTMVRFANKSVSILVATDVAARGLDIDALDVVINFELPRDIEVYVHRIGRTGRAGSKGAAYSLFTDNDDYTMALMRDLHGKDIVAESLPPRSVLEKPKVQANMVTLQIDGGKKQKLRPGDILGGLTGENGISGKQVGKIQVMDTWSFVAVAREAVKPALNKLAGDKIKGRSYRARVVS